MTKLMNNFSYYLLNSIVLLISLSISGCIFNNPAHSPSITGDIEILKDSKGDLCFMPLLDSATFMEESVNVRSINMEYLTISDPNSTGGDRIKINIEPRNQEYFTLKDGQKICLNSDNSKLEETVYTPLDKQSLSVSIAGLDDKKELSVIFYKEFDYPYLFE
ncbi:MAG: hypothetical protein R3205_05725 [Psychrobacter sp.]|jgi:hypothetical protein|uniref:hypothetical protein n=1 Tax=Psychrobacter maritimus TaxID=256325 RepID=UPI00191837D0|nr:hypothetical protein [Psychrobacter maritimus]MDX1787578.1 hypothetical protein [Psychrobacter sp.]